MHWHEMILMGWMLGCLFLQENNRDALMKAHNLASMKYLPNWWGAFSSLKLPLIRNTLQTHQFCFLLTKRQQPSGSFWIHSETATPCILQVTLCQFDKGQMNPGATVQGFKSMRQLTVEIIICGLLWASRGKVEAVYFEHIYSNG